MLIKYNNHLLWKSIKYFSDLFYFNSVEIKKRQDRWIFHNNEEIVIYFHYKTFIIGIYQWIESLNQLLISNAFSDTKIEITYIVSNQFFNLFKSKIL